MKEKNQITKSNERYYSVKQISEMINVPISTLHDTITRIFPNKKQNGKKTLLNDVEIGMISKELKKSNKIQLTDVRKVAITEYEELEIIANAMSIMQRKIKEMQPKVEKYDLLIETHNTISIGECAKSLNIGRNTFFNKLRQLEILDKNNIPYQRFMQYFEVRQIEKNGEMYPTTFINAKGIDYISEKIKGSKSVEEFKKYLNDIKGVVYEMV